MNTSEGTARRRKVRARRIPRDLRPYFLFPEHFEDLERRIMLSFGVTQTSSSLVVDTGAQLVFTISKTDADVTSMQYKGTEMEAPFSLTQRYSHYESGLSSTATTVSFQVNNTLGWILVTATDSSLGVTQFYMARQGFNNLYMATYTASATPPAPGEMRFIAYMNRSIFTNFPAASDVSGGQTAIEGSDVFANAAGQTHSKFYGALPFIDDTYHGITGNGVGAFMVIGSHETSSGGPFFKDIDFQTTDAAVEMYNYMYSGHTQTEAFRPGLQGPYAISFTNGGAPAPIDFSFMDAMNLSGWVPASGRGSLSGVASGVPATFQMTVGLANSVAEYWGTPDNTGHYTITAIKPGTYTETLYQGQLAVGTQNVTITAGGTTSANIASTWATPSTVFSIGQWDGTPLGFLNADKIETMHPSDTRMTPWPASTVYTVGSSSDSSWPLLQAKDENNSSRIVFTLNSVQAASQLTLRIGITFAYAGGRPFIVVNQGTAKSWTSAIPAISNQPDSRGITRGTWRGNNTIFTYVIPISSLQVGTNTIDITVASGSTTTGWLSPSITYDAIDLLGPADAAPTVAVPASATPNPVTGPTTNLSVLGADDGGESNLTYTWSATGPAAVAFSANGTHAARNTIATFSAAGTYSFLATITDTAGKTATSSVNVTVDSSVVGRDIFYNGSVFDSGGDDAAIATDKSALLPGQTASFANYTSYSRGINGIMIDIDRLTGTLTLADFTFKVGGASPSDINPANWATLAASPAISMRPGAGVNGSTRVELIWNDNTIQNEWLQVTVNADDDTQLAAADVFYFGNAIGESGNSSSDAKVDATDQLGARDAATASAAITDPFDFNRDGVVDGTDESIAQANNTYFFNALQLFTAPQSGGSQALLAAPETTLSVAPQESQTQPQSSPADLLGVPEGPVHHVRRLSIQHWSERWGKLFDPRLRGKSGRV